MDEFKAEDAGGPGDALERADSATVGDAHSGDAGGAVAGSGDPRDTAENRTRRADHVERMVIEMFFGGSRKRFDDDAGVVIPVE